MIAIPRVRILVLMPNALESLVSVVQVPQCDAIHAAIHD